MFWRRKLKPATHEDFFHDEIENGARSVKDAIKERGCGLEGLRENCIAPGKCRVALGIVFLLVIAGVSRICQIMKEAADRANTDIVYPHKLSPGDPLYQPKKVMTSIKSLRDSSISYTVSELAKLQIENYRTNVSGLILHIHITHHAGTEFCNRIGHARRDASAPPFACRVDIKTAGLPKKNLNFKPDYDFPTNDPWSYEKTAYNIARIKEHFHFLAWEYYVEPPVPDLRSTNWEDPNLLSVIIMRDPISRLLARDGWVSVRHKNIYSGSATEDDWWRYANDTFGDTDNFALRIIAGFPCCDGEKTDLKYLAYAKALLSRFTIILDMDCLDQSMEAFANLVGIPFKSNIKRQPHYPPSSERIPYKNVYNFLLQKNRMDIKLYEWSKNISLVRCHEEHN